MLPIGSRGRFAQESHARAAGDGPFGARRVRRA